MNQVGESADFIIGSDNAGSTETFSNGYFIATATNVTETVITSLATGRVNQMIDRYTLRCADTAALILIGVQEISIPGKFLWETNI